MSTSEPPMINLKIEFGGGLELLFNNQRSHRIALPSIAPPTPSTSSSAPPAPIRPADITFLISWLKNNLLTERAELFVDDNGVGVRPGILVLINDTDWELEGEGAYEVREGDEVVFISTLHGG